MIPPELVLVFAAVDPAWPSIITGAIGGVTGLYALWRSTQSEKRTAAADTREWYVGENRLLRGELETERKARLAAEDRVYATIRMVEERCAADRSADRELCNQEKQELQREIERLRAGGGGAMNGNGAG